MSAEAKRWLDDDGNCVENCNLADGEPCAPCPPGRDGGGREWQEATERYQRDVAEYSKALDAHARANPEFAESERYHQARTSALNFKSLAAALARMASDGSSR